MVEEERNLPFKDLIRTEILEARRRPMTVPPTKRSSKHAPKELSSKFPVPRFRKIAFPRKGEESESGVSRRREKPRDPRFERSAGHFNAHLFNESYRFIGEYLSQEAQDLETALKETGDPNMRKELRRVLNRKKEELRRREDGTFMQKAKKSMLDKEKAAVLKGKRPYFLKRKAIKMCAMKMKLDQMEAEGKLDQYEARKRKRQQHKEKLETLKFARMH